MPTGIHHCYLYLVARVECQFDLCPKRLFQYVRNETRPTKVSRVSHHESSHYANASSEQGWTPKAAEGCNLHQETAKAVALSSSLYDSSYELANVCRQINELLKVISNAPRIAEYEVGREPGLVCFRRLPWEGVAGPPVLEITKKKQKTFLIPFENPNNVV